MRRVLEQCSGRRGGGGIKKEADRKKEKSTSECIKRADEEKVKKRGSRRLSMTKIGSLTEYMRRRPNGWKVFKATDLKTVVYVYTYIREVLAHLMLQVEIMEAKTKRATFEYILVMCVCVRVCVRYYVVENTVIY